MRKNTKLSSGVEKLVSKVPICAWNKFYAIFLGEKMLGNDIFGYDIYRTPEAAFKRFRIYNTKIQVVRDCGVYEIDILIKKKNKIERSK